jgi:hypothetical protein
MATLTTATDVADELGSVAGGLSLADQLGELESALRALDGPGPDSDQAAKWASLDLLSAFLGEENDVPERRRLPKLLDIALQVLVFVPIAVTWLGLFLAARAYSEAGAAGALHGESFMQGWQTGFGGRLPGLFAFDKVALYIFALVAALIVIMSVRVTQTRLQADRRMILQRRLASALIRAGILLAPYRESATEHAAAEFNAAADKVTVTVTMIDSVATMAADAQQKASEALATVTAALASVERATVAATTAATTLEAAPAQFGDHLDQLATATSRVGAAERDLIDATAKSSDRIADALKDGAEQVRVSVDTISATAAGYVSRTEVASDILGQAQQAIDVLPNAVGALHAEVRAVGGQLASLDQVTRAVADLRLALDAMRQSLDVTAGGLGGAPQVQRGLMSRLTGAFSRHGYP